MAEVALEKAELKYRYLGQLVVDELTSPTPPDWIEERPIRGGGTSQYIQGYRFIEKLNQCFGMLWNFDVLETIAQYDFIVIRGKLTITIPAHTIKRTNGDIVTYDPITISKTQFGGSEVKKFKNATGKYKAGDIMDLGNDYKAAATDALKKCSVSFGMFSDVYRQSTSGGDSSKPSKTQLEAVYLRGSKLGMDKEATEQWVTEVTGGKKLTECDQTTVASQIIPKLIELKKKQS